ncbi:MAG TPA: lipocalin family protein [Albitalea sp.]|uniref:lipocalin family protein n=1 Tax=Piscinibacter sp. TaxID=1903157 RepID=UPI002ED32316
MPSARLATVLTRIAVLGGAAAVVALGVATAAPPVRAVDRLDLSRYAGTWYELAHLPNSAQARCVADATATYRPLDDGSLKLIRRCREPDERWGVAVGRAIASDVPGAMRVNYLPDWLAWWPSAHDDHWVVLLDDDYRYAVVSDPARKTLWILSRTPELHAPTYRDIVERLRTLKYPVDRLVTVPQHAGPRLPSLAMRPALVV